MGGKSIIIASTEGNVSVPEQKEIKIGLNVYKKYKKQESVNGMPDKIIKCKDCGVTFTFTEGDQEFYREKGYKNEPQRCPECRAAKKNQTGGNNRGGYGRENREMYPAVCSECGKETTVPFKPAPEKPVFCPDCFRKMRTR